MQNADHTSHQATEIIQEVASRQGGAIFHTLRNRLISHWKQRPTRAAMCGLLSRLLEFGPLQVVLHCVGLSFRKGIIPKAKGIEGEKLVRELAIPAKATQYEDEGFKYYPDLGLSIQGQSASDCWKEVERLAKKWRIPVTVEFWWRQNPKAQHPGKTGVLRSGNA